MTRLECHKLMKSDERKMSEKVEEPIERHTTLDDAIRSLQDPIDALNELIVRVDGQVEDGAAEPLPRQERSLVGVLNEGPGDIDRARDYLLQRIRELRSLVFFGESGV